MGVKILEQSDLLALRKLWSICFLSEMNLKETVRQLNENSGKKDHASYYGYFLDTGEMTSAMAANHYTVNFSGHDVPFVGIGGVVTLPEYRRTGAIRKIFEKLLRDERASGCIFSGLYPFSHEFYRKFGYELGYVKRTYTIPLSALEKFSAACDVRMLLPDDDRSHLVPVYDVYYKRYSTCIKRNTDLMEYITRSNPYEKNDYTYALYENGQAVSYISFTPKRVDEMFHMIVKDYAFLSKDAFFKLLGFLNRLNAQFSDVEIVITDDIPILSLVDSPYDVSEAAAYIYMTRVLNTEKALSLMHMEENSRFVIEVTDDFLPENSGRWLVTPSKAEKTNEQADVSMSIQTFSQLAVGFISFDEATFKKDVTVFKNAEMLSRVFLKKPIHIGVFF